MNSSTFIRWCAFAISSAFVGISTAAAAPEAPAETTPPHVQSSTEQGQTAIDESFNWPEGKQWPLQKHDKAFEDTTFKFNFRTYYFDRNNFDGSENEAWAAGGWAGLQTGYFLDHIALGVTGYTSQHLQGSDHTDGTQLLAPGQESYSVLGELYTDIQIVDDTHLIVGRKEFDTPFINRDDSRMPPNTFEAIALQGSAELGNNRGTIKYGAGYFDQIKNRNSDDFISMSRDAGATVDRGVFTAGGLWQKGDFSVGAIDYYSPDIINIAYLEAKYEVPVCTEYKLNFAAQYTDQSSVGDNLLTGGDFSARQFGLKAELNAGQALFTTAFTSASGNTGLQNPWSGYPGYTAAQVQDFDRQGEDAFLLRAGYDFTGIKGLGAYALGVFGSTPDQVGQYRQDEYNVNLQWAPPSGALTGFALRMRYGIVTEHGSDSNTLTDFRAICNYAFNF